MVAHEWRQPLGALQFAVRLLREAGLDPLRHERTLATVERNVEHLADLTLKLEAIARVRSNGDNAVVQTMSVATVAQEAARQLREMADAAASRFASPSRAHLTVDVGRLEPSSSICCRTPSNIRIPRRPERHVEVIGRPVATEASGSRCTTTASVSLIRRSPAFLNDAPAPMRITPNYACRRHRSRAVDRRRLRARDGRTHRSAVSRETRRDLHHDVAGSTCVTRPHSHPATGPIDDRAVVPDTEQRSLRRVRHADRAGSLRSGGSEPAPTIGHGPFFCRAGSSDPPGRAAAVGP